MAKMTEFQRFMALLDPDRFEEQFPRRCSHAVDTSDLMRRGWLKRDLLKFDGERGYSRNEFAYTVNYELSKSEMNLYDEVTEYVREEMNRAELIRWTAR